MKIVYKYRAASIVLCVKTFSRIVTMSLLKNIQVTKFMLQAFCWLLCPPQTCHFQPSLMLEAYTHAHVFPWVATDALIEMISNLKFELWAAWELCSEGGKLFNFSIFTTNENMDCWQKVGLLAKSRAVFSLHQICYKVPFCRPGKMFSIAGYDLAQDKINCL